MIRKGARSVEKEARRELREETGLLSSELVPLHRAYSSPSIMKRRLYIFLARGLKEAKGKARRDDDILEVIRMPITEAIRLLQNDFVTDSTALGYILLARTAIEERKRAR
jgi:ADP-ribose pyrophosphatase